MIARAIDGTQRLGRGSVDAGPWQRRVPERLPEVDAGTGDSGGHVHTGRGARVQRRRTLPCRAHHRHLDGRLRRSVVLDPTLSAIVNDGVANPFRANATRRIAVSSPHRLVTSGGRDRVVDR